MFICVSGAQGSLKRISDPLEQESQMVVSLHVGAGHQTGSLEEHFVLLTIESSLQLPLPNGAFDKNVYHLHSKFLMF